MNEISRCCRVLGVKHGASLEDVKKAYRDLVQVWHPDRFSHNERLQLKAQEQTKEINSAYDYLVANAFQDDVLVEPEEVATEAVATVEGAPEAPEETPASSTSPWGDEPAGTPEPEPSRAGLWALIAVALVFGIGVFWFVKARSGATESKSADSSIAGATPTVEADPPEEANPVAESNPATTSNSASNDISPGTTKPTPVRPVIPGDLLPIMTPMKNLIVEKQAEGTVLRMRGATEQHLQTPQSYRPPFTIRTRAKTSGNNLRLHCGASQIIFNWEVRPSELRVEPPLAKKNTGVPEQGALSKNEWHVIVVEVFPTGMRLTVDGQLRYQNQNDNKNFNSKVGIGPRLSRVTVDYFIVEKK